ncbi:MAG: molybdopterin-dependent oxidoreductase [Spirochaetaceae bacterium]|jgi:CO/xanthine dehydrogenase Mo-binding subunit|nr:molybdopterin-dependent oxidoreductase [Spirochaetaceae bacterium]
MFVDDIPAQGAFPVLIIRSPKAKGRLKSIRCLPLQGSSLIEGGYRLITAEDIPGTNMLFETDMPVLASDSVSYIGQPLALLAGPDKIKLAEYAKACLIEIEEEEAFLSIAHPENIFCETEMEGGSPPKSSGTLVIEGTYETGIQEHWYTESHGALAEFFPDNAPAETIRIKTASQCPAHVRDAVAALLQMSPSQVHVENADTGITFDGKIWYPSLISCLAALAAYTIRKPVKLQLKRQEDYVFSPKRCASVIHIKSTLSPEGVILDTEVEAKIGFGAYALLSGRMLETVANSFLGVYKMGKIKIKSSALLYNIPPTGPFAGFGSSFAAFALERHISKICDAFKEEGSGWRISRLVGKLKSRFETDEKTKTSVNNVLCAVSLKSGYKRKWAVYELLRSVGEKKAERVLPQRGIGIAFALAENRGEEDDALPLPYPPENQHDNPMAAMVIEIEIDRINYEAKIRSIWLYISSGHLANQTKAKQILRCSLIAALGWVSTEKIKYENGMITPELSAHYQILPVSETPPITIDFIEEPDKSVQDESVLESLPFSVVPAAYTQAITQAVDYHLERIPITGQDIWRVMHIRSRQTEEAPRNLEEAKEVE